MDVAGFRQAAKHSLGASRLVGRLALQLGTCSSCYEYKEQTVRPQTGKEHISGAMGSWVCNNSNSLNELKPSLEAGTNLFVHYGQRRLHIFPPFFKRRQTTFNYI